MISLGRYWIVVALASCVAIAGATRATAQPAPAAELQETIAEVIAGAEPAVVAIRRSPAPADKAEDRPGNGSLLFKDDPFELGLTDRWPAEFQPTGAGVLIDPRGLVLTLYLNVRPGHVHTITTTSGETFPASIKAADPRSGLAVLQIEAPQTNTTVWPTMEVGDADRLRKGHIVVAIGNPLAIIDGGSPSASWGSVTNLGQKAASELNLNNVSDATGQSFATTLHHLGTLIEIDAKVSAPGGGALVDIDGKLVGVMTTTGTLPGHDADSSYAIPMNAAFRRVVDELRAGKEVEYGLLGLSLGNPPRTSATAAPQGAIVLRALPGTAAALAGLQANDLLTEVDGRPLRDVYDLQLLVGSRPPTARLMVGYERDGRRRETPIALSKYHVRGDVVVTNAPPAWRGIEVDYATSLPEEELLAAAQTGLLDAAGCVVVSRVAEGSSAWQAGVRPGMFISHANGKRVTTPEEFRQAVADAEDVVDLRFTNSEATENRPPARVERQVPEDI